MKSWGADWLPLTRELSSVARLRERKVVLLCISIPSLPSSRQSRATSLVRGRQKLIILYIIYIPNGDYYEA